MSTLIKRIPHGQTKYLSGVFVSDKNNENFSYKSSYELAYLKQLEADKNVVRYIYEPFEVAYIDSWSNKRMYRPDFLVLYKDGAVVIAEIKPEAMLEDYDVKAKAKAAMAFISSEYEGLNVTYRFVTEKHLFKSDRDYFNFIREHRKGK